MTYDCELLNDGKTEREKRDQWERERERERERLTVTLKGKEKTKGAFLRSSACFKIVLEIVAGSSSSTERNTLYNH